MGCNLNYMRRRMQLGAQPHKVKASGAVATFRTNLAAKLDSLFVDVTPVQDLHGQQYPYPAGGSKNLFGAMLSDCKTINTSGTWTGDSYAVNGVTYSVDTTNDGYITSIRTSGTATATTALVLGGVELTSGVSYIVNGCPANGGNNKYEIMLMQRPSPGTGGVSGGHDYGEGLEYTETTTTTRGLQCVIRNGQNSTGLVFYPMVRLATVSDASFMPYSNVCPITGWAAAKVTGCGVNLVEDSILNKNISSYGKITNSSTNSLFLARVKKGVTYTFSQSGALCYAYFTDKPEDDATSYNGERYTTGGTTVVAPIDGWIAFRGGNDFETPMIVVGDTLPAYKPYVGTTAVIQFGQTLYGARIDWKGRKAVVTHALFEYAGESLVRSVTLHTSGYYYVVINPTATPLNPAGINGGVVSNEFIADGGVVPGHSYLTGFGTIIVCVLYDQTITTRDAATAWFQQNPAQFLYKLAEPVEIPLDLVDFVTVPGVNNVFADCGNVDLSYWTNV